MTSPGDTLTVTAAALQSIALSPNPTVAKGLTQQFTATGTYSDGSTANLTSQVTWASATASVATISNAVGTQGLATALATGTTVITATLGGVTSPGDTLTVTAAALQSIALSPTNPTVAKGLTQQFTATGTYSDGSTANLTSQVTWASATASVATISNAVGTQGLATALATGTTVITATLGGVTSPGDTLTVTAAALQSIALSPTNPTVAKGLTQQFTATGTYSDGSTANLTSQVTWASATASVATISNAVGTQGLATALATGTTAITATLGGVTSPGDTLTVTAAALQSIALSPTNPTVAKGLTQQFTATGTYSDGSTANLTSQVTWASATASVATISNAVGTQGLATALATGTTVITATLGGVTSPGDTLTVTAAALQSIALSPTNPTVAKGLTQQFTATGTYSDGSTANLTSQVTWASATASVATISNAVGTQGLATALATGTTVITATLGGVTSPGDTLTVTAAALQSIAVSPNPTVAKGLTQQFTATGTYSDGSTANLTSQVTWASATASVATISNAVGTQGLATALATGTTVITATLGGVTSPGDTLTVTAAALQSIALSPTNPTVAKGLTQQFTATGTYSDGSTANLTSQVTWASATASVATISNAVGTQGLATALATGTTVITATLGGVTSPGDTLTVTAAALQSIALSPTNPTVAKGLTQQFTATGTYSDGSTANLTSQVTWASATASVATISNAVGTQGLATALATGTTVITATLGGVTSPGDTLTVTAAALQSIALSPTNPTVAKGLTQQFTATGTYSDGSTANLTSQVTWASATASVATISNAVGTQGLATALATGTTVITATLGGVTSPGDTLTVTAAALQSIALSPTNPTVAKGLTQQFTATGTYSDGSTANLTTQVTWVSGTPSVATISNTAGSQGLASTLATGTTAITATLSGITSPSDTLTVTAAALSPGVYAVGTTLYVVGANTSDYALISPWGSKLDGSTGLAVVATLNNAITAKTFSQTFTAIDIFGYGGNDVFLLIPTLTLPTTVVEGNGNNYLQLAGGNDSVTLGSGSNQVFGGNGNKTITDADAAGTSAYISLGNGNDTISLGAGNDTVSLGYGNDSVAAGNGNDNVTVGNGNDNVQLGNGSDVIVEGNGNDNVSAGNGPDLVVGGLGQHTIQLGNGNDILIDGSATVVKSGDSLRQILSDWNSSSSASVDTRLKVVYNTSHPNVLKAGSGRDWFFFTYSKDVTNKKSTDRLN